MAAILSISLGAGIRQNALSSMKAEVKSRTSTLSLVGTIGAAIKSTS